MLKTHNRRLRRLSGFGALAGAVTVLAAPLASADPITDALATTSCNYAQVTAALNAQSPTLAAQLRLRPDIQANLKQFLALPVEQRQQQLAQQQAADPQLQAILAAQLGPTVTQVANTCMNY